ncbi:putative protein OS=Ureibacillus acetophenoni OX=614649 GN=SAMN05877842_101529 PE=4 SV=1 [Ureibacillus acetophenoni]
MLALLHFHISHQLGAMLVSIGMLFVFSLLYLFSGFTFSLEIYIFIFITIFAVEVIAITRRRNLENYLNTFPIKRKNHVMAPMLIAWGYCVLIFLFGLPVALVSEDLSGKGILFSYSLYFCMSITSIAVVFYINYRFRNRDKFKFMSYCVAIGTSIVVGIIYIIFMLFLGFIPYYLIPVLFHIVLWISYKKCVRMYEELDIV